MQIDPHQVTDIIRRIAVEEVMSRFRQLANHEVSEKAAGEIVTIADTEAERRLGEEFMTLLPGSKIVGEEGAATNPDSLKALDDDAPVWIVDPVDGTKNFSEGKPCFAVMAALVNKDQIEAAWIHDPIADSTIHAVSGEGAWENGIRLEQPAARPMEKMTGSFPRNLTRRLRENRNSGISGIPNLVDRYRCVGREYMDMARGKLNFLRYGGELKPWDHTPGILINRELGGFDALVKTGDPYLFNSKLSSNIIMLTENVETWKKLTQLSGD